MPLRDLAPLPKSGLRFGKAVDRRRPHHPIYDHNHSACRLDTVTPSDYHILEAEVAQLVEHSTENAGVVSSILTLGTSTGP